MSPLCEIKFDNQNPESNEFWSGEKLRCNIVLNLTSPRMMKGVYVTISGWANCSFNGRNRYGNISCTTYYSGKEGYINSVKYLVGSESSNVFKLPIGIHTYSYVYDIPPTLPSSIEGEKGHIRYNVRVTINRPFPLLDDNFKQDFTLVKPFDLNTEIDVLSRPFRSDTTHRFCCFICKSEPFSAVAVIPQYGYAPGEIIKIKIRANNESNVTIDSIKTSLCQIIEFFKDPPSSAKWIQFKKVANSLIPGIPTNQTKTYKLVLKVPDVVPTDIVSSRTIHVAYCLKIKFNTSWLHTSPTILIPIKIGTIPLKCSETPLKCSETPLKCSEQLLTATAVVEDIYDSPARYKKPPTDDEVRDKVEERYF